MAQPHFEFSLSPTPNYFNCHSDNKQTKATSHDNQISLFSKASDLSENGKEMELGNGFSVTLDFYHKMQKRGDSPVSLT